MTILLLTACGLLDAPGEPIIEAHRGAAGYWPENSRTAMLASLEEGFDGIEFDVVLTSDEVPVLMHDPTVSHLCTDLDGNPEDGTLLVKDLTLEELQRDYRCGGVPDEDMPEAEVIADTVMTLDELLVALVDYPDVLVHIDMKYEEGLSSPADRFAEVILTAWEDADLPNEMYVSGNSTELTLAVESFDPTVETSLVWPEFPTGSNGTLVAVEADLLQGFGISELVARAEEGQADGLALRYETMDWFRVEVARQAGLRISVWTINDADLLANYADWPVDSLITDYPREAP